MGWGSDNHGADMPMAWPVFEVSYYCAIKRQKIPLGGPGNFFLVINLFYRGPYGPPSRSNWTP